jgi:hypothetical protein
MMCFVYTDYDVDNFVSYSFRFILCKVFSVSN